MNHFVAVLALLATSNHHYHDNFQLRFPTSISSFCAAMVMAAQTVADDGIEVDDPAGAATISDDAVSSMLEKGKRDKNETKDIGIQAFNAIL